MPQSRLIFAVSLQEHPELLDAIIHLSGHNVNGYYCPKGELLPLKQLSDGSVSVHKPGFDAIRSLMGQTTAGSSIFWDASPRAQDILCKTRLHLFSSFLYSPPVLCHDDIAKHE
jgi:hypothetical protein